MLLAAALLLAAPAAAVNVVTNGDFSAGNTGFASGYSYRAPGNYGGALAEGLYAIDTDAFNSHLAWVSFSDHAGDAAALYLIANGAGNSSSIWMQTVTVAAKTEYSVSAFSANLCCNVNQAPPNFSQLAFHVDNGSGFVTVGSFTLSGVGVWIENSGTYTTSEGTTLDLRIINTNTVAGSNDFALDDISFAATAVPEPASWALLVAGFRLVGVSLRRRSRAVAA